MTEEWIREFGEGPEGDADVLAYINATPMLLSLLYDLDLLPEQHPDRESKAWEQIFIITGHFREAARELLAMQREADAKVCEAQGVWAGPMQCAAAIRKGE